MSVDLEIHPKSARLFAFAAVHGDASIRHNGGALDPALDRLEVFCEKAEHIIGHNILRHDIPHLVANRARLAVLAAAPVDTLWLNPLAFPRNPYHHLVKHYRDGRLQAGHINDPEKDANARLALQLLADQISAFAKLAQQAPDALLAYHYLTSRGEGSVGFDALFRHLRGPAPDFPAAHAAIRRLLMGVACSHRLEQTLGRLSDERIGWPMAYALSGIPERHDALERVRMGDAAILLISPKQLRSPSIRSALQQREVSLWVLDEAHCVSKLCLA
ncbi:hypothetical protein [Polymorphobacter multimanifer]|uniref:Helicase ATP-binding domain-containing protein n=1 Tax=Polymorphobacter multimanifer TaxID=1070431 RepID=A0A841LGQ1_9SPHN|nr:hypothetical protein [Polymorphobacter multimanifer]MBB6228975.1 hypothetical protein [Polymorphobacter multimanifer]